MHYLSAWFTKNSVAANLLMVLILLAGYFTATSIRIEGFPAIPPNAVTIFTVYPGGSAEQVDLNISRRLELSLDDLAAPATRRVAVGADRQAEVLQRVKPLKCRRQLQAAVR